MKIFCAVLTIFALVAVGQGALVCPDGYTRWDDKCFIYQAEKKNFDDAIAGCGSLGGVLAEPDDACKNQLLVQMAEANGDTGIRGPYIGGRRIGDTDEFEWVTSPESMTFTYWGKGEPNNERGDEHCLHYWLLKWNDVPCHWKNSYFCQIDAA